MDEVTRRFLSIVVVAMMLLGGLLAALILLPEPDEDGGKEDPGWRVTKLDNIIVYDDAVWSGWDEVLEYPVIINPECTLTVEDSRLEVPLERLVFEDGPAFDIGWDGKLVLSDSTLVVDADPQLANAMFDAYPWSSTVPLIWRVVNLLDAQEPFLEFEVELMGGEPFVVVATQVGPQSALVPLVVIEPEEMEPYEWVPVRVSLRDLVGSTPRVVLTVLNSTGREVLISNITLMDGDGSLPGDVFGLGDMEDDGWAFDDVLTFTGAVSQNDFTIEPLIKGAGDLLCTDSSIVSVPAMSRDSYSYRPQASGRWGVESYVTMWSAPDFGSINVSGSLTLRSTEVSYVPIKASGGEVNLLDCTFTGDCEMVTIAGSSSTVTDCEFAFHNPEGLWGQRTIGKETWMLALEGPGMPTRVSDCTFRGEDHGAGLVINGKRADLNRCSFSGLDIGVWVHMGGAYMHWDDLGARISFDGTCSVEYLETAETRVEMDGVDEPSWGGDYENWNHKYFTEVPGLERIWFSVLETAHYFLFCVPITVVRPEVGMETVGELEVEVHAPWAWSRTLTIDPREDFLYTYFGEEEEPDRTSILYDISFDAGGPAGVLTTYLGLLWEWAMQADLFVNVSVDGAQVDVVHLNETFVNWSIPDDTARIDTLVPPGPHEVGFVVGLESEEWNVIWEMDNTSARVFRASSGDDADEVNGWFEGNASNVILVDPGVRLEDLSLAVASSSEDMEIQHLCLLTWDATELVVDRVTAGEDIWLDLRAMGPGSIVISELTAGYVSLTVGNCTSIVGSTEAYITWVNTWNSSLTFQGDLLVVYLVVNSLNNSVILFDGDGTQTSGYFQVTSWNSSIVMKGCKLSGEVEDLCYVRTGGGSTFVAEDCEFDEIGLIVFLQEANDTYYIRNCTFRGPGSYLRLNVDRWTLQRGEDLTPFLPREGEVSGNVFTGEGAGMVFLPQLRGTILGENDLIEGARAYALYYPEVSVPGHGPQGFGVITMDALAYHLSTGVRWTNTDQMYDLLVDVTEDPLSDSDPGLVPAIIRRGEGYYYYRQAPVVGFQYIPVSEESIALVDCFWGENYLLAELVEEMVREYNVQDNWWTG